jgi:hypothetical protein
MAQPRIRPCQLDQFAFVPIVEREEDHLFCVVAAQADKRELFAVRSERRATLLLEPSGQTPHRPSCHVAQMNVRCLFGRRVPGKGLRERRQ